MTSVSFDPRGFDAEPDILEPERASILAILALVFGLICFIPLLPLLGIICGIAGLIVINRSRGRLAGTGMAIAGLILGLLFTALQAAIILGMAQAFNMITHQLVKPVDQLIMAIDQKDFATARQALDAHSQTLVTDEAIAKLGDEVRAEMGAFKSIPTSLGDLISAYGEVGQLFQATKNFQGPPQGQNGMMPVPAHFENGTALVLVWFDPPKGGPGTPPGQTPEFTFRNISIITKDQKVFNLIEPTLIQPPTPGVLPSPPPPPPPTTPAPEAPASDAPTPEGEKPAEGGSSGGN